MGLERNAKRARRALDLHKLQTHESVVAYAKEHRVRPRTVRRGMLKAQTGTYSFVEVAHEYMKEHKLEQCNIGDAVRWKADQYQKARAAAQGVRTFDVRPLS